MKKFILAALVVSGCMAKVHAEEQREITVFAAASLREAFEDLAKTFEAKTKVKVRLNRAARSFAPRSRTAPRPTCSPPPIRSTWTRS
jgi:ABC-type molybdate transport system substrate-binding protein